MHYTKTLSTYYLIVCITLNANYKTASDNTAVSPSPNFFLNAIFIIVSSTKECS